MNKFQNFKVLIVAEGDSWAGIESHLSDLIPCLLEDPKVSCDILLFSDSAFADFLRSKGAAITIITKSGFFNTIRQIVEYIQINKFDIIHTHSLAVAFYISTAFLVSSNKPKWIYTQHSKPEPLSGLRNIKGIISRLIVYPSLRFMKTARVIAVSGDLAGWIIQEKKIPLQKVKIIRNGISIPDMKIVQVASDSAEISIEKDTFIISIVGRLVPVKGHRYLIEALDILKRDACSMKYKLLIIGEGPLLEDLRSLSIVKGVDHQIEFLGYRKDARSLIKMSSAVAIPSIHEGIPYTLLEAMALKKPVIASDVGGLREVLTHDENAFLVKPADSKGLSSAIQAIAENKMVADKLALGAVNTVQKKYSSHRMAAETVQAYKALLEKNW